MVSADAYILFYQKQSLTPNSSSTSSASSSSSSNQEHWVYRMPDFSYKNKTQMTKAQQQSEKPTTTTGSSKTGTTGSSFARNSPKYATLPVATTTKPESETVTDIQTKKALSVEENDTDEVNDEDKVEQSAKVASAETKSLQSEEKMQVEDHRTNSSESLQTNNEDVSRPIDKNDVD